MRPGGAVETAAPASLLAWYDANRRELPWRDERDPYRVWLSEVMLQQTRVETVLPYYRRFVDRFPTVEALAAAEPEEVLALWAGLGYYRRARSLHRAAREVVAAGALPSTAAALEELPGIGPYTAAAVASIAFGEVVAVLDGNVERVICRRLAWPGDPRSAAGRRELGAAAAGLLDPERPGDSNQALMELGATVCLPSAPRCEGCPLTAGCAAFAAGQPELYPRPRPRRPPRRETRVGALAESGGRVLLVRRPENDELLAGLWELPWVRASGPRAAERALAERYGGAWRLGPPLGRVRHSITHRAIEVEVRGAVLDGDGLVAEGPEAGWFAHSEIAALPRSSLVGKILRLAGGTERRAAGEPTG